MLPEQNSYVERPHWALALVVVGAIVGCLGYFAFEWGGGLTFADIRDSTEPPAPMYGIIAQAYTRFIAVPLLIGTIVVSLLAPAERTAVRVVNGAIGVLGGVAIIVLFAWIETGGLGTAATRQRALPMLLVIAAAGVVAITLGAGAALDSTATMARALVVGLATIGVVLQVYVVIDVFADLGDAWIGAWSIVAGYLLLASGVVVPYRRIIRAPARKR